MSDMQKPDATEKTTPPTASTPGSDGVEWWMPFVRPLMVASFVLNVWLRLDKSEVPEKWMNALQLSLIAGAMTLLWRSLPDDRIEKVTKREGE